MIKVLKAGKKESLDKDWQSNGFYKKLGFKIIGHCADFFYHKDFVIYTRLIK